MINIILPMPPSVNEAYAGKSRRFKSKAYKRWLIECQTRKQTKYKCRGDEIFQIKYFMHSNWFNQDGTIKRKDASNYLKLPDDYLSHIAKRLNKQLPPLIKNFDDKQIFEGHFYKVQDVYEDFIDMQITEIVGGKNYFPKKT